MKKSEFNFINYLNAIKGIYKATPHEIPELTENQKQFNQWMADNGAVTKGFYPAMFGDKYKYSGMIATESVAPYEIYYSVPSKLVITSKKSFYSEANFIFRENPEAFTISNILLHESIIGIFLLWEKQKGDKSFWKPYVEASFSGNKGMYYWSEEDFTALQDPELVRRLKIRNQGMMNQAKLLFRVVQKYPQHFDLKKTNLDTILEIIIGIRSRVFGNRFWGMNDAICPGIDLANHENVGVYYDLIVDGEQEGKYIQMDMLKKEYQGSDPACDVILEEEDSYLADRNAFVLNKEVIPNMNKVSYQPVQKEDSKNDKDSIEIIEKGFAKCEDDFTFILKTRTHGFEKGSQLYLAYGHWPNDDMIIVYGFCSFNNVFNCVTVQVVLTDEELECYNLFRAENPEYVEHVFGEIDYYFREFKIFIDGINIKLIKFMKIITLSAAKYPLKTILKPQVLEIEYIAIEKATRYLEHALNSFPTTHEEDMEELEKETKGFNYHIALIYRSEMKKLITIQIKAMGILKEIINRLIQNKDFNAAIERVEHLETEEEVELHRKMMENYLSQVKHELSNSANS